MSGRWMTPMLLLMLAGPSPARAEDTGAAPLDVRPARRLELGRYGRVTPASSELQSLPRFQSEIEVIGVAPKDANAAMAVHWRQWNLSTGSIYGKGINFHNQGCPTCVNILPLIGKVVDAIKKK